MVVVEVVEGVVVRRMWCRWWWPVPCRRRRHVA
jgi:hypothetical protein